MSAVSCLDKNKRNVKKEKRDRQTDRQTDREIIPHKIVIL